MESVEIIATDKYLPKRCITNKSIEKKFDLSSNWISTRTGINQRFYSDEDIFYVSNKSSRKFNYEFKNRYTKG